MTIEITPLVITGRSADSSASRVRVELRKSGDDTANNLHVSMALADDEVARTALEFYPDGDGYPLGDVTKPGMIGRVFAVVPVDAEAGKSYRAIVRARWEDADGNEQQAGAGVVVPIDARPEVYLALGALEFLREKLKLIYDKGVEKGRAAHEPLASALPRSGYPDPSVILSKESLDWAMEMIQLGSRIYRHQEEKVRNQDESSAAAPPPEDERSAPPPPPKDERSATPPPRQPNDRSAR